MNITIIISICSLAVAFTGVWISYRIFKNNLKKDTEEHGETRGVMASDIGYIKAGVDDLKRETRETRVTISDLNERVTRCEESTKSTTISNQIIKRSITL